MIPLKDGQITYKYWQESVFDYVFLRGNIYASGNLESGEFIFLFFKKLFKRPFK